MNLVTTQACDQISVAVDGRIAMQVPTLQALKKYRVIFVTVGSLNLQTIMKVHTLATRRFSHVPSRAFESSR